MEWETTIQYIDSVFDHYQNQNDWNGFIELMVGYWADLDSIYMDDPDKKDEYDRLVRLYAITFSQRDKDVAVKSNKIEELRAERNKIREEIYNLDATIRSKIKKPTKNERISDKPLTKKQLINRYAYKGYADKGRTEVDNNLESAMTESNTKASSIDNSRTKTNSINNSNTKVNRTMYKVPRDKLKNIYFNEYSKEFKN